MCSSRFSFGDARPDLGEKEKLPTFGVLFLFFYSCREAASFNKQLERTVMRRHVRAASAPFHYAHAARWTAQRAAAQLRRYPARTACGDLKRRLYFRGGGGDAVTRCRFDGKIVPACYSRQWMVVAS
jgi:hypothetical protein